MALTLKRARAEDDTKLVPLLWGQRFETDEDIRDTRVMEDLDKLGNVCHVAFAWSEFLETEVELSTKLPTAVILTENGEIKDWDPSPRGNGHSMINAGSLNPPSAFMTKLSVGYTHFAAVSSAGVLFTFGIGLHGCLGHGGTGDCLSPEAVAFPSPVCIVDVACGEDFTLALSTEGNIYSWGTNVHGRTGHGTAEGYTPTPLLVAGLRGKRATQVAAGTMHAAAIISGPADRGIVYSWGSGADGELGNGEFENCPVPAQMVALDSVDVVNVSLGMGQTVLLTKEGRVLVAGDNDSGGLGLNHEDPRVIAIPTLVEALRDTEIVAVSCCGHIKVALTEEGEVYEWYAVLQSKLLYWPLSFLGLFTYNIYLCCRIRGLGDASVPVKVESLSDIVKISNSHCNVMAWKKVTIPASRKAWRSAFTSPEFADVTFVVEGVDVPAHRVVLATKSEYFRNMFFSSMQESSGNKIEMKDVAVDTFKNVLSFLYTGELDVGLDNSVLALYKAADMYRLEDLKAFCLKMVDKELSIPTVGLLLEEASRQDHFKEIRNICMEFALEHYDAFAVSDSLESVVTCSLLHELMERSVLKRRDTK